MSFKELKGDSSFHGEPRNYRKSGPGVPEFGGNLERKQEGHEFKGICSGVPLRTHLNNLFSYHEPFVTSNPPSYVLPPEVVFV